MENFTSDIHTYEGQKIKWKWIIFTGESISILNHKRKSNDKDPKDFFHVRFIFDEILNLYDVKFEKQNDH